MRSREVADNELLQEENEGQTRAELEKEKRVEEAKRKEAKKA